MIAVLGTGPAALACTAQQAPSAAARDDGTVSDRQLALAMHRAARYFATQVDRPDPSWLPIFAYLKRRYGARFELSTGSPLHDVRHGVLRPEVFHVYYRLLDPSASVTAADIQRLPTLTDRVVAAALHCAAFPLPEDWIGIIGDLSRAGGYALTHATLAIGWAEENGCFTRAQAAPVRVLQVSLLEQLIHKAASASDPASAVDDLWIEAVAMMYYAGAGQQVRTEWIQALLRAQREDGGWAPKGGGALSHPHPSALALWILLENLQPQTPRISFVPQ